MTKLQLRGDKLQWLETGGEVVALDESELAYLGTNESASLLWKELARGTTREQLIEGLVAAFAIDRALAARDVDAFVADLKQRSLLEK